MKQLQVKKSELKQLIKNYWYLDATTAKIVRRYVEVEYHEDYHV